MNNKMKKMITIGMGSAIVYLSIAAAYSQSLWDTAKANKDVLAISTLFTASGVDIMPIVR
jgi:hypothetical protein